MKIGDLVIIPYPKQPPHNPMMPYEYTGIIISIKNNGYCSILLSDGEWWESMKMSHIEVINEI